MNRILVLTFLFCAGSICARAEELRSSVGDPWLWCGNGAALTRCSFADMGTASLSLTKEDGGFVGFSDSPDALSFHASVESFFRLDRHAVVYGKMSYTNFSGRDMAGSAFITSLPSSPIRQSSALTSHSSLPHLPFDIVEDSLGNSGTKHQDTYRLTGGVGYDLGGGFSLGGRLDFTAANYAKYKDLRHKNKLMDLDFTAGFYLPLPLGGGTDMSLGAHYLYHRTTEGLQFSTYGKNDKVYYSLISYANFMGHVEQFGSAGYTDKSREMPLVSDYNGVGVQLHFSPAPRCLSLFQSFTYAHRRGYYGRRSPYTITYTGHESDLYSYAAGVSGGNGRGASFSLDLSIDAENLRNEGANYRELQNEQGASYYEYYTPVKTANKLWCDGSVAFTAALGGAASSAGPGWRAGRGLPVWLFRAGMNWHRREQTAYVYPFGRRQDLSSKEPFLCLSHTLFMHKKSKPDSCRACWTFTLDFSFLKGSGRPYEDVAYQAPSDKQEAPPVMDAWLWRDYRWLTSAQFCVGGSVKYSFVMPWSGLRSYLLLSLSHRKANGGWGAEAAAPDGSSALAGAPAGDGQGRRHTVASFAVGCHF